MIRNAQYWIGHLHLSEHPEGGYFKDVYRSNEFVTKKSLPERYTSFRSFSTSIYFLLESHEFSGFHRLKSDEIWHFYEGSTLTIFAISPGGTLTKTYLGNNPEKGDTFQLLIPKGFWFTASLNIPESYSLVGCTVSPGFDFEDFELGKRIELEKRFPQHKELIRKFTIL